MQARSIFRASQALGEAKHANYQLSHLDFPRYFGKRAAEQAADQLRAKAVASGERAALLFEQAGFDPQAVTDVRKAVAYLRNAEMNRESLQRAHHSAEYLYNMLGLRNRDTITRAVEERTRTLVAAHEALNGTSPDERLAQATALFERAPASLDGQEWLRLAALLETNPSGRLLSGPHKLDGFKPLAQIAREIGTEMTESQSSIDRWFSSGPIPTYFASWRNAITAPESALVGIRSTSRPQIQDELKGYLAGFPGADRATAAPAAVGDLIAQTRALIDRNLARMAGTTPSGALKGYSTHPDYAEIGRIRANAVIIDELTRPVSEVDVLTPTAAQPATQAGEVLTW